MNIKDIDSIAYLIKQAVKKEQPKPIVFLGAGASVSAGIPGTNQIIKDILEEYADKPEIKKLKEEDKNYYKLMACLNTQERHELLRKYITDENVKINVTHIYLAQMLNEGYIDYVLTVNFDDLFLKACALFNFIPPVYDISILKDFTTTTLTEKSISYLHGQHHGFWLLNTDDELKKVDGYIPKVLNRICDKRTWIIIGYSGEDRIFDHISSLENFTNELFWIGHNNSLPAEKVQKELLNKDNSTSSLVSGYDSDSFFLRLHSELGMSTPDIFNKPFSFLKGLMGNIRDIEDHITNSKDQKLFEKVKDRFDVARKQTDAAIKQYEESDPSGALPIEDINRDQITKDIIEATLKDNYEFAEELLGKINPNDETLKIRLSPLYNNWGVDIAERAESGHDLQLYNDAIEKYKTASLLDPKDGIVYSNWGTALTNIGKEKKSIKYFKEAIEKFIKSSELSPNHGTLYYSWAYTVSQLGDFYDDEKLYLEAVEKYKTALSLMPEHSPSYNNLGQLLSKIAKKRNSMDLYKQAIENFENAIKYDPRIGEPFHNWSVALISQAKLSDDSKFNDYIINALDKAEKAVSLGQSTYNVACCFALLKNKGKALFYLNDVLSKNEISIEHVLKDDDWNWFFDDFDFKSIINKYS